MQPVDQVLQYYPLPFTLRQDQVETINTLCQWDRKGCYYPVGGGKTAISTLVAFYWALQDEIDQIIVLCPPILLRQWATWLESFKGVEVCLYRGTPAARKKLSFGADCIVTTPGLFKNDFERFMEYFGDRRTYLIIDEATCVRQVGTQNHRAVRDFMETGNKMLALLTGTTISAPHQAYGYIKLIAPNIYRDYRYFTLVHITDCDQYGTPRTYKNLDLLAQNMCVQTVRREAEDIMDLPDVTYMPVVYDLDAKHMRLYKKVVDELLVELDDGEILDALIPQKLRNVSQRVILMPAEFGGEKIKPAGFGLIDEMISELGGEKLMIYCNYNTSNEAVYEYCKKIKPALNPVLVYGGPQSTTARNIQRLEEFKSDPDVKVVVGNPRSCGIGVDGLQHVCHASLFLELPTPDVFNQAVGRIKRQGQGHACTVKIAVASNTIQVDLLRAAMKKEDLAQRVVPTKASLRAALTGG